MRFATTSALAIALAASFAATATAQNYPSRTVTVVVPFPAGGSVDGVARILVQKLNETAGQHFIVENRAGGASGIVGANAVAKAAPDGYTQADVAKVLALPDVKARLNGLGFDPMELGGEQFAGYVHDEMAKYEKIIKDAKISVE